MADTLRFRNLDGSGPVPFGRVLRWAVLDRLIGRRRRAPDRAQVPEIRPDVEALRKPPLEGIRVTWLGHASWLVQGAGTSVLIDPALGPRISGVIARNAGPGLTVAQLPPIDAALVTHNHYDHLDLPTLRAVGAPLVAGVGTRASLRGLPCTELGWWDRFRIRGLEVTFVPSQHWSRRGLSDVNEAL
ncbi:MAG: MBL fold metallo-hydrolase, partial [Myxococcaceae bacterium]